MGHPAAHPTYPQYQQLWETARARGPFVDPTELRRQETLVHDRGSDWCSAVLGRPFPGLGGITVIEGRVLLLADEQNLNPPLPAAVVANRAAAERHQATIERSRQALRARDQQAWDTARRQTDVEVEVRPNLTGRRTGVAGQDGPLRHAVPVADAWSGTANRPRRHPEGRAVCETENRHKPRRLGGSVNDPATCKSCLRLVPKLRTSPQPTT